jgi:diguanylate cyclase (GGDEF)-like protein
MIDITDLKEQEIYIKYLAEHDPLTGIYNRRKLFDVLEEKLVKGEKGWILLLDLDNFKNINDTLGHFYGDNLLKNIADVLKMKLRQEELYRIGGDEFIILLEEAIDVKAYCNKILEMLKEEIKVEELGHPITASIGVVKYPKDGKNIEELLKKVDISMYQGKFSGKSKCMVFDQEMEEKFTEKIKVETMMRNAIREDGFQLVYQPIIEVSTGNISHVEALLRLKDMSISPGLFIPIAEESDLIIHMGKWVINKVAEDIKSWQEKRINVKVAINISPKQLYDRKFIPYLKDILNVYKISPQLIELEITENILLENKEENIKLIKEIKDIGYTISLDDFGTGYSSINYLSYIPLDKLKLDKSIKDRFVELNKIQIIDSIVNIAHGLDLKVVAEGVETDEEYRRFKRAKCDYVQGYYISQPLDKEKIENFIIKNRNGGIDNDTNTTH